MDPIEELHACLCDATAGLHDNNGYLEMCFMDNPLQFSWQFYDYDVEIMWTNDGGSVGTRPTTPAPAALIDRLRAVAADHGVPCVLAEPDVGVAPDDDGFAEAYGWWLLAEGPQDA